MEIRYTFRNIDSSEALKSMIAAKLDHKIAGLIREPAEVHAILEKDRYIHRVELVLHEADLHAAARGEDKDMYKSIDKAVHKLYHQVQKDRDRHKVHKSGRTG